MIDICEGTAQAGCATNGKPRLLVISHVLPYPGDAGQQQRVAYTLTAARRIFAVDFLTYAAPGQVGATRSRLSEFCDRAIVLKSVVRSSSLARAVHKGVALLYMGLTGLKESNYQIGVVEFSPRRLAKDLVPQSYACVLYELMHAAGSTSLFRQRGVPTVVDTHNVLWRARENVLRQRTRLPKWLRQRWLRQYRHAEEAAWQQFDAVVAINRSEESYIKQRLPGEARVFYAPMGIDLDQWSESWQPARPPRIAFYGGLGSPVNQEAAARCLRQIMPPLWEKAPELEFWLVGSNPPAHLQALAGSRIKVTGFLERPEKVLRTMSAVLCPWSANYGFRSRLVEVMALGVPVVATPEAADGMELVHEQGILLGSDDASLARESFRLLSNRGFAALQSKRARQAVECLYSVENTYGRFVRELQQWLGQRAAPSPLASVG